MATRCEAKTVAIYRDGTLDPELRNDVLSCIPDSKGRPHENGTDHYCGFVENETLVFEWNDGKITRMGKEVNKDGSEKGTNVTTTEFALPDPPPIHTIVKAGPKTFTRFVDDSTLRNQWQEVGNIDNVFNWAQLFGKAIAADGVGAKVTVVGMDAEPHAKATVVAALRAKGASMPNATSRGIIADLKDAGLLVGGATPTGLAKVGDVFRIGVDALPANVTALIEQNRSGALELTVDPSNGLWRFGDQFTGWADWATNKDTRDSWTSGVRFKSHGTEFKVTKIKGV